MFRPKKPEYQPPKSGRIQLNLLQSAPKIQDIRMLLVEAQQNRGAICQLPISTDVGCLLACVWDHGVTEPVWTLFEGLEGTGPVLWSYPGDNLEMICDITNMSLLDPTKSAAKSSTALPPELAPKPEAEPAPAAATAPAAAPTPAPTPAAAPAPAPEPTPAPAPAPMAQPPAEQAGAAQWGAGAQQPGQYPPQGMPQMPPQMAPGMPYQQWGQPQIWPQQMAQPQAAPANPDQWASRKTGGNPQDTSGFADLLEANSAWTLNDIVMHPQLPSSCVDAALRLQEMVCKGQLTEKGAFETMIRVTRNGGTLNEGLLAPAFSRPPEESAENIEKVIDLLKTSQLITDADIAAARSKNAADPSAGLIAIGKIDALIWEAAKKCSGYTREGRLPEGKAIIALHYCVRARASLEDAFSELSIDLL